MTQRRASPWSRRRAASGFGKEEKALLRWLRQSISAAAEDVTPVSSSSKIGVLRQRRPETNVFDVQSSYSQCGEGGGNIEVR